MSQAIIGRSKAGSTAFAVLGAITFCHLLNDVMQSLLPTIYPLLKSSFSLSFGQIGFLTLVFNVAASLLQPFIGFVTDRRPQPSHCRWEWAARCSVLSRCGLRPELSHASCRRRAARSGKRNLHPESSRLARLASGGAHEFAQSVFQVGGNVGQALGPLLAAFVIVPYGRSSLAWFGLIALVGMCVLVWLGRWNKNIGRSGQRTEGPAAAPHYAAAIESAVGDRGADRADLFQILLSGEHHQLLHFLSHAAFRPADRDSPDLPVRISCGSPRGGTFIGGPIGDRFGRRTVIWGSILGVLPFTLVLPYVGLTATIVLTVVIGLVLSSAFSAILVYAQELMPGHIGMVSGLFFGLAFGMGGIGAAVLGLIADHTSIGFVYHICAFLPLIGLLTVFLPQVEPKRAASAAASVQPSK